MSDGKPVRRLVTIDDEEGKSIAIANGPCSGLRSVFETNETFENHAAR
jgi:hypothetical protein